MSLGFLQPCLVILEVTEYAHSEEDTKSDKQFLSKWYKFKYTEIKQQRINM